MSQRSWIPEPIDYAGEFQFYCNAHNYGWSIDGDGASGGCPLCESQASIIVTDDCAQLSDCLKTDRHSIFCPMNPNFDGDEPISAGEREILMMDDEADERSSAWSSDDLRFGEPAR